MRNDEVVTRSAVAPSVGIPLQRSRVERSHVEPPSYPHRGPAEQATGAETAASPAHVHTEEPTTVGAATVARRSHLRRLPWLPVSDAAAVVAAGWGVGLVLGDSLSWYVTTPLTVLVLLLNATGGHYRAQAAPSLLDELPSLAGRALVAGAVTTVMDAFWGRPENEDAYGVYAALWFLVLASSCRAVGYALVRRWRMAGRVSRPTIIVGTGAVGDQIAAALLECPEYGMRPVGFVDDGLAPSTSTPRVPLLGGTEALPNLVGQHPGCDVVVADSAAGDSMLVEVIRRCDRLGAEIFVIPRLHEVHGSKADCSIRGLPITRLRRAAHRSPTWRLKRLFDVVAGSLGLVLLSPLFAICAVAVYLEGGPGVLFRQERVGLDGRRFEMLKFRSLTPADTTESEQRWSIQGDSRVGPVGRALRTLSLDELPQLWNVVRGDMSLVGPRPERPYFVGEFSRRIPSYDARHRAPAGLTGWAQISGLRGDTDIAERARFDNHYIQSWSFWMDVKILLRTIGSFVSRSSR